MNKTPLNKKPVIVTSPGRYITRDGRVATVLTVVPHDDLTVTMFNVKGILATPRKGKRDIEEFTIWHQSGFTGVFGESPADIISVEQTT